MSAAVGTAATSGEHASWGEWNNTNIRDGHATDRTVAEALQELYMNAMDGAAETVGAATIDAKDDGSITITNPSMTTRVFDESVMMIGGQHGAGAGYPNKMGRHSLGLKDALAVLLRDGWCIELMARGARIQFELRPIGAYKLIHWRQHAVTSADNNWVFTLRGVAIEGNGELVGSVKSFFKPPDSADMIVDDDEVLGVRIYRPNVPARKKKPETYRHDGKAGIFIGNRFVLLPDSQVTYFGWHVTKVSDDIKKLISRDQILTKGISGALRTLLQDVTDTHGQQLSPHLPKPLCRELKLLLGDKAAGGGGVAGPAVQVGVPPRGQQVALGEGAADPVRKLVRKLSTAAEAWGKQLQPRSSDDHKALLTHLNSCAQKAFPDNFAQVIPYGSVIYQVETRSSDIDATLSVVDSKDAEPTKMLKQLQVVLKADGMNVREQFEGKHPILIVQKDNTQGVPFDVDISFNGHLEVHKSHEVAKLLATYPGAHSLAQLVKEWASKVKLKGPAYLPSYTWMLIVIQYMAAGGERTDSGFFGWFDKMYPLDKKWIIGNGKGPFTFETDNAAQRVQLKQKEETIELAKQALANIRKGVLPWSKP